MLDGKWFKKSVLRGYSLLKGERELLNKMNFFPVADGDTGTNLLASIEPAVKALNGIEHLGKHVSMFSQNLFENAKGSSGTILSFFFLGFSETLKNLRVAELDDMYRAIKSGARWAYLSVQRPVEGTMLTVLRYAAKGAKKSSKRSDTAVEFFESIVERSLLAVEKSPVLMKLQGMSPKTDSGALGVFDLLTGFLEATHKRPRISVRNVSGKRRFQGYCMNFLVETNNNVVQELKRVLSRSGSAVVVKKFGELLKVHVHSTDPQEILKILGEFGSIKRKKIEEIWVIE